MKHAGKRKSLIHMPLILCCLLLLSPTTLAGPKGKANGHGKFAPGLARLLEFYDTDSEVELPVIIQMDPDSFHPQGAPPGLLKTKVLDLIHGFAGSMSVKSIQGLVHSPWIRHVSGDPVVKAAGNPLASTIGLEQYFQATRTKNVIGYNGKDIKIAIFDSGLTKLADFSGRIEKMFDFTSGVPREYKDEVDVYGHGTHVAGITTGTGEPSQGNIAAGIAPESKLVVLKVLDDTGAGSASNVILAIDWLIQNQDKFKGSVRVANLSLGHPAFESYETDPLCQAVRAMVDAGIVTVVSAGNLGKTVNHPKIWGGITSPGTEPSAITVGAVNTQGTITHSDDVATSYSSRGYTVPHGLLKPDLVAPGNMIAAPADSNSYLYNNYPQLVIDGNYMYLSGSSMATAVVSGTAALMLDANESLNPTQVKTLLLLSAVKMTEPHMFEQGNGFLNAYTAIKLAEAMDVQNEQLIYAVDPTWTLNGENGPEAIVAGGAFVWDDRVFYSDLVDVTSSFWGDGVIWADNLFDPGSVIWTDNFFDPGSVIWSDFFDSVIWADFFDGVIWADDFFDPDGVIWADGVIWNDQSASSIEGD